MVEAVGIISLGLQICKELSWYFDNVRNVDLKIRWITDNMDSLALQLEQLEGEVGKVHDGSVSVESQAGISACKAAFEKIKKELGPINNVTSGESKLVSQLRGLKRRLLFPFKQEHLLFCEKVMERIRQDLNTAISMISLEQITAQSQSIAEGVEKVASNQKFNHTAIETGLLNSTNNTNALKDELLQSSDHKFAMIQASIGTVQTTLSPLEARIEELSQSAAILSRLEAKIDNLSFRGLSPDVVQEGIIDLSKISKRVKRFDDGYNKRNEPMVSCRCHGQRKTTVSSQSPLYISQTIRRNHNSTCPYSKIEEAVKDMYLRISFCSVMLKRKAQLSFAFSRGAGSTTLAPALSIHRVVDKSSPAFKLIASFGRKIGPEPDPSAWIPLAMDLYKLFETRAASPHDRLPNGWSLLHYLCSRMKFRYLEEPQKQMENFCLMAQSLFDFMPMEALEKDDTGQTCVDLCLWGGHTSLIQRLIEHGTTVSLGKVISKMQWDMEWAGLKFDEMDDDVLDCSDRMKSILLKSESRLATVLCDKEYAFDSSEDGYSLYEMATLMKWRRGCEMIFEQRIPIEMVGQEEKTFLALAIRSNSVEMIQFWLEVRKKVEDAMLECIGSIEDAFQSASSWSRASAKALLSALVEQRRQLQELADVHFPSADDIARPKGLLDIQARDVFDSLEERGVRVPLSLKPSRRSVYQMRGLTADALDELYEAGFRDPTASIPHHQLISNLLYRLTSSEYIMTNRLIDVVEWFVSKGAALDEPWPGSNITAFHFFGWNVGNSWSKNCPTAVSWTYLSERKCADGCRCLCSSSGCVFITMIAKGLASPERHAYPDENGDDELYEWECRQIRRQLGERLAALALWVEPAAKEEGNEWLIGEFIRLAVFLKMDLPHTCCDPQRVKHSGDPDFDISPYRSGNRTSDDDDCRDDGNDSIAQDDDPRLPVFESLVRSLTNMYTPRIWTLEDFLWFYILEEVREEMHQLRKQDLARFAEGRMQMGVIMEVLDTDDEEETDTEVDTDDPGDSGSEGEED